jgi:hypothetical protein
VLDHCRNGHDLTRENARVWTGDHFQCRTCRLQSGAEAQSRYAGTVKGMLASIRDNATRRGGR